MKKIIYQKYILLLWQRDQAKKYEFVLSEVKEDELTYNLKLMNNRPRKCYNYKAPLEVIFEQSLNSVAFEFKIYQKKRQYASFYECHSYPKCNCTKEFNKVNINYKFLNHIDF